MSKPSRMENILHFTESCCCLFLAAIAARRTCACLALHAHSLRVVPRPVGENKNKKLPNADETKYTNTSWNLCFRFTCVHFWGMRPPPPSPAARGPSFLATGRCRPSPAPRPRRLRDRALFFAHALANGHQRTIGQVRAAAGTSEQERLPQCGGGGGGGVPLASREPANSCRRSPVAPLPSAPYIRSLPHSYRRRT